MPPVAPHHSISLDDFQVHYDKRSSLDTRSSNGREVPGASRGPNGSARLALAAALVLGLVATAAPPTNAAGDATEAARAKAEVDGSMLADLVTSKGALGIYWDEEASRLVVVVPSSGDSSFAASDASRLGVQVVVETRDIDLATIDRITDALIALRPSLAGFAYGFGFDPVTGMVVLRSEAPETAFALIQRAFPGKISFHLGKFELTSQSNDAQPHSGGAYLNGQKYCTSGFTLEDNNNHRWMVTAGHCNDNGVSTNMGTIIREPLNWPYYDFETVTGHTYGPYIYDSPDLKRPVVNAQDPVVGASYCTGGRTSGTKCSWTLLSINNRICYNILPIDSECTHKLAAFSRSDGIPVQPGDSGGPFWYSYSSPNRAGIRGVISGRFWDVGSSSYYSYASQYQNIATFYVAHAAIAP